MGRYLVGDHTAPKLPAKWRNYTKGIVAIAGAVGVALTPLATGDGSIDLPEAIQALVSFLTAIGVISFKNKKRNDVL